MISLGSLVLVMLVVFAKITYLEWLFKLESKLLKEVKKCIKFLVGNSLEILSIQCTQNIAWWSILA